MGIKADTGFSLKDDLFNANSVAVLAGHLARAEPSFNAKTYQRQALQKFPELELKERIHWLVSLLETHLPADFADAVAILIKALPEPLDPKLSDNDFGSFIWVVPGEFVARHGCTEQHLSLALTFLAEATKRFTSESAIRPFLKTFPEQTMGFVRECSTDTNYHVRRLASEGIRPFLPWAARVHLPVPEVLDVLSGLHADSTRYVTRSVANTLNDLSKVDPDAVLATLTDWHGQAQQQPGELAWMTRHALRTLLKKDHPGALAFQGYAAEPAFRVTEVKAANDVLVGDAWAWQCTFTSTAKQRLRLALRIHYLKANGSHAPRVFALQDREFAKGEQLTISKAQSFRPMTTRALYPGEHHAELVVNGVARQRRSFTVRE